MTETPHHDVVGTERCLGPFLLHIEKLFEVNQTIMFQGSVGIFLGLNLNVNSIDRDILTSPSQLLLRILR